MTTPSPPAGGFFKTLKHEEVNLTEYRNLEEAAACIGAFIEQIYNPPQAGFTRP